MTDNELEMKLKAAVERTAPDGLSRLLSDIDGKGAGKMNNNKKRKPWIGIIAACLALALIAGGGGYFYRQNYAVATVVSLDVNPSIELNVNRAEKVIACSGLNAEGREILSSMGGGADLKGAKLNVAVNAIVGAIVKAGYLDSLSSAILISVEDNDTSRGARLQAQLVAEVDGILQSAANSAGVLSQSMTVDKDLAQQAQENSISAGKAALVNEVLALNPKLDFAALAQLSVEELRDLIAIGAPAMPIGKTQAILAASEYAGVLELDSVVPDVDPELDDLVPHYEVELTWGDRHNQYEYTVDAFTGEVLSGLKDAVNAPADAAAPGITAEEAFNDAAAYFAANHPELTGNFLNIKTDYDWDDGRYDVEFWCQGWEFDYDVDGRTGQVLREETDYRYTPTTQPDTPTPSTPSTPSTPGDGTEQPQSPEEAAKALALGTVYNEFDSLYPDFGTNTWFGDNVKAEYDWEDGLVEIELWAFSDKYPGGVEFDFEVDPSTPPRIVKTDTDYDPARTPAQPSEGNVPSDPVQPDTPSLPAVTDIGADAAKAAALSRAGITDAASVTWIKAQREYDDGRLEYELEFYAGTTEYEITVDAATGQILKYETETISDGHHDDHDDEHDDEHHTAVQTTDIGADAAKSAALAHAGLSYADVTRFKCERDYDDGRLEYEIEFVSGNYEYEYKIDAATGAVLEHEKDICD